MNAQAAHPALNMELIAQTNPTNLSVYYPLIEDPVVTALAVSLCKLV